MTAPAEVTAFNVALLRASLNCAISVDYPEDRLADPDDTAHVIIEDDMGREVFATCCKAGAIGSILAFITVLIDGGLIG